jgi:hypothetical protein
VKREREGGREGERERGRKNLVALLEEVPDGLELGL